MTIDLFAVVVDAAIAIAALLGVGAVCYLVGESNGYWRGRRSVLAGGTPPGTPVPPDYPEFLARLDAGAHTDKDQESRP